MSLLFWVNFTILTLVLCLFTCEAQSEEEQLEGNNTRSGRYTRSLSGLYTALGILDLVGSGLRLGAEIANLVAAIGSVLQLFSPQQQLAQNMETQLQLQQMLQEQQSQNMQNQQDQQNMQYSQEMQSQACTATFSYYASNGNPVYQCDCPSGTSYQYLRCVNPDDSVTSDVQNPPDIQQQDVQNVQEQPCTATFSYYASDSRPVYYCDCPGYGISYQYNRCISPKYARDQAS